MEELIVRGSSILRTFSPEVEMRWGVQRRAGGLLVGTSLSLVIPAYNEGTRLVSGLQQLMAGISPDDTEILVVDDGSTDDTAEVARCELTSWPQSSVVSLGRNCGKGAAVKAGVIRARGDVIAYIDADMAADPRDLAALVRALDDCHVAVGSRAHGDSVVDKRGARRAIMNRTFGMLVASMTQLPYMDTQCGFKAFKSSIAKILFHGSRVERFAFDVEVLDLATRLGLRTKEVPVRWADIAGSHVRPIRDGMQMLGDVARIRSTRRHQPAIPGVLMPGVSIEAATAIIQSRVRKLDLMIKWEEGTAVLFPCLPVTVAQRVSGRLLSDFESYNPEVLNVEFGAALSPILATGVRSGEFRREEATAIGTAVPSLSVQGL
jgi:dolichyl-phosphate beta-glucosyltransferase